MMWIYEGKVFNPDYETILRNHWAGFVYIIKNDVDEKAYIGKKTFHAYRKVRGGKKKLQSTWVDYWGSSEDLTRDIMRLGSSAFSKEIISIHKTRHELGYNEIKQMFMHDVLQQKNTKGERMFYNNAIWATQYLAKDFQ